MGVLQQAERAQQVALAQAPAQSQQLDLSGTTLSPQLWPNRRVATLLVANILEIVPVIKNKISQYLVKMWSRMWCLSFLTRSVVLTG